MLKRLSVLGRWNQITRICYASDGIRKDLGFMGFEEVCLGEGCISDCVAMAAFGCANSRTIVAQNDNNYGLFQMPTTEMPKNRYFDFVADTLGQRTYISLIGPGASADFLGWLKSSREHYGFRGKFAFNFGCTRDLSLFPQKGILDIYMEGDPGVSIKIDYRRR